ncbi:2-polyprenyl-3-methyl-5-hydroxy-6-metoxy-1,4-benzoquinol methylase [Kineosphaera limosa]|uniref:Putative methyltransferase n=1 Tax=Kineosphaera limosa NBRC 100340 TaxID=1184609 RepID=K6XHV1_9MICO|nr:2-polyprenyl-3-methyl-5-hydroxy-6-metoxy-1,4-benzoquinol methylase [Kineosphaera limosa]GAB98399.1 putative methyltransferase [Kineosphaera limosa NBRC 100340]
MFVFGVCIDSQEVFDRHCLPAIAQFGGADATLITSTDKPIAVTYNQMLAASLDMADVEAVVLLRPEVEITDPRFLTKIRAAFAQDDRLAIIGVRAGPADGASLAPVDAVDDTCMVLRPSLTAQLRFDEAAFRGTSGYDIDFCFRAREAGFHVALAPIDVVQHRRDQHAPGREAHAAPAAPAQTSEAYRSAAAVWQGKRAADLRASMLRRIWLRSPDGEPRPDLGSSPALAAGFDLSHAELLEHLPSEVTRVLDVGCGSGSRGQQIKATTGAHVAGIEGGAAAARLARTRLDEVHELDLTTATQLPWQPSPYDVIVLADVLARVAEPEALLRMLLPYLTPQGSIILTVPNVKHWSVILPLLLQDRWEYQAGGPLQHANLRFFTMIEIAELLRGVGMGTFDACAAQQLPLEDEARLEPLLSAVRAYGADADEVATLLNAYQYVVVARRG